MRSYFPPGMTAAQATARVRALPRHSRIWLALLHLGWVACTISGLVGGWQTIVSADGDSTTEAFLVILTLGVALLGRGLFEWARRLDPRHALAVLRDAQESAR